MQLSERARSFLLGAALVACGAVYSPVGTGIARFVLPKELALHLLVVVLLLGDARRARTRGTDAIDRAMVWWVLALVVSSLMVTTWPLALRQGGLTLAYAALFVRMREWPQLARFAALLLAGLLAVSAVGEASGLWALSASGFTPGGLAGQRNHLAHGVVLGLSAIIVWAPAARAGRVAAYFGAALFAAAIVLTRSRAAYLAGGLVVIFALPFVVRRESVARGALGAVVVGALSAPCLATALHWTAEHPYRDSVTRITESAQGSGAFRVNESRATLVQMVEAPQALFLGFGPGQWSLTHLGAAPPAAVSRALADGTVTRLAHNDLLARGIEGGLIGAIAAGMLLFAVARALREDGGLMHALPFAAALVVVECFDAGISIPSTGLIATLLLAAAVPRARDAPRSHLPSFVFSVSGLASVVALVVLVRAARADLTFVREDAPALLAVACTEDPTAAAHCTDAIRRALVVRDCAHASLAWTALSSAYPMHPLLPSLRAQTLACSP